MTYTSKGKTRTGIPADELEKVLPSAVQRAPDGRIEGVDYEQLVPVLLEAIKQQQVTIKQQQDAIKQQQETIQKQQAMIEDLQRRVAQLEGQR